MPRKPRAEASASPVQFRLSPQERQRVDQAVRVNHQTLSEFGRDALLDAAEDCLEGDLVFRRTKSKGSVTM